MDKNTVVQLFRERAFVTSNYASYEEMVNELAALLAASRGRFSKEAFEVLLDLGGALYKAGLSQYQARDDIAAVMQKSAAGRYRPQ